MVCQVNTVQSAFINPAFELISHLLRVAHNNLAHTANSAVLGNILTRPLLILGLQGEGGEEGLNRLGLHIVEYLIFVELGKIHAGPAADNGLRRFQVHVLAVLFVLCLRLLFGFVHNNGEHREDLNFVAAAAVLFGAVTNAVGNNAGQIGAQRTDKHNLCVLARELLPAAGCARLENHGGALGAGLGQTRTGHAEVLALVLNRVHLGGVGVDTLLAVFDDRAVFPGAFPELVADVQELFGEFVSGVVLNLGFKALTFGCGRQV